MQHSVAKNAYGLGASTGGFVNSIVRIPALGDRKIPGAGAAVLQIPRGQERKFDIQRDPKFGAPSTAALGL